MMTIIHLIWSNISQFWQIMYRYKKCQIGICQNCAIRCHKGHPLIYSGLVYDSFCYYKDVNDCKCTDRKTVIRNYSFYGSEFIYQPWFVCLTCGTSGGRGCCAAINITKIVKKLKKKILLKYKIYCEYLIITINI